MRFEVKSSCFFCRFCYNLSAVINIAFAAMKKNKPVWVLRESAFGASRRLKQVFRFPSLNLIHEWENLFSNMGGNADHFVP